MSDVKTDDVLAADGGDAAANEASTQETKTKTKRQTKTKAAVKPVQDALPEAEQAVLQDAFPQTVTVTNATYAVIVLPEHGGAVVRGGASADIAIKSAEAWAALLRNIEAFNAIGKWQAPRCVSLKQKG